MGRVNGKVIVITGGARGMGASHARRLIEEGAKVALTDVLDEEGAALAKELGSNARFLHHDVTQEAEWHRVIAETEAVFGPISVLVNNAGIAAAFGPTETLLETDYRRVIDVNQVSVFLGMKAAIPSLKRVGGGAIINISSIAGLVGSAETMAYTASKFAVRGMTKAAAVELAPFGIRVNSIHPGIIRTPMTMANPAADQQLAALAAVTPAKRVGEPDEVSSIVVLLASDETKFTTGTEFVVDGGVTCQ